MKKDRAKRDEEVAFARRVRELYHATLDGTDHFEDDREVRAVAFGFVAITQALNDRKAKYSEPRLVQAGVPHAFDLVDGLMLGSAHPVWTFINGVRHYRGGRAASGETSIRLRELFAGVVLAYKEANPSMKTNAAAAAVADGIKWEDHQFSAAQILTWIRRNKVAAQEMGQYFLAEAAKLPPQDSLPRRVLAVGRFEIFHSSATVPGARP